MNQFFRDKIKMHGNTQQSQKRINMIQDGYHTCGIQKRSLMANVTKQSNLAQETEYPSLMVALARLLTEASAPTSSIRC
jgi:hypothetical protein